MVPLAAIRAIRTLTLRRMLGQRFWHMAGLTGDKYSPSCESTGWTPREQVTRSAAKIGARVGTVQMKRAVPAVSASASIDERIKELSCQPGGGSWRGKTLAKVREIIHAAAPEIVEEWKWMGTPVWSPGGIVCTGETYKKAVKMTFAKGKALNDPAGLFNSSLEGNVRRAIDIH